MKRLFTVALALLTGAVLMGGSCRVRTDSPDSFSKTPEEITARPETPSPEKPLDIGDAEASLSLAVTVPEPAPPNFKVDQLENLRGDIDLVTVDVAPPHPQQFPLQIKLSSKKAFAKQPLVVRISVFRDKQPIQTQAVTMAADAANQPFEYTFDALQGMPQPPATMLIHAEAEIIMLPEGSDLAAVDPATVQGTPETTGAKVSNPVRVNFKPEAAAP